jgi:hypothetical protein
MIELTARQALAEETITQGENMRGPGEVLEESEPLRHTARQEVDQRVRTLREAQGQARQHGPDAAVGHEGFLQQHVGEPSIVVGVADTAQLVAPRH